MSELPPSGLSAILDARINTDGTVNEPSSDPLPNPVLRDLPTPTPVEPAPTPVEPIPAPVEPIPKAPLSVEDFVQEVVGDPVEPTEGGDDDDDGVPVEVLQQGDKAAAAWRKVKADLKAAKKALREAAPKAPEVDTQSAARIAELEQRLAEREERAREQERIIAALDIEESEEFIREVRNPIIAWENKARSLAGGDKQVEDAIIAALSEPDVVNRATKLGEVADGMPEMLRHTLYTVANELDRCFDKQATMRAQAPQMKQALELDRLSAQREQTTKQKQAFAAAGDVVWGNIQKNIPGLLDETGALLPEFQSIREKGASLDPGDPNVALSTRAFAGYATQLVPVLAQRLSERDARIEELETSIQRLTGASPGKAKNNGHTAPVKPRTPDTSGSSLMSRLDAAIDSGQVTFGS